jgi:hypothetical protein
MNIRLLRSLFVPLSPGAVYQLPDTDGRVGEMLYRVDLAPSTGLTMQLL